MASKKKNTSTNLSVAPVQPTVPPVAVASPVAAPTKTAAATPAVAVAAPARSDTGRDRSTIIALIAKLRDQDADVARDAAVTIGKLPADAEAVDALCAVVRNTDGFFHSVVRAAAAGSLGTLGDRRAVDALIVATADAMAEASEEAIKALGLLGDARAVSTLEAIIRNDNGYFLEPVRNTATEARRRIKA